MKMNNKKHVSLIVVLAMLIAYVVPAQFSVFAAIDSSLGLSTISENYTFIAENFVTANVTSPTKFDNDRVLIKGNVGSKQTSEINGSTYGNILRTKGTDNYIAFNVDANAVITVYGKNSSSSAARYFMAAQSLTKPNNKDNNIAYSEDNATVFTFTAEEASTIYVSSYNSDDNENGDAFIAGFTVEYATLETSEPTLEPTDEPQDTTEPTAAPTTPPLETSAPAPTQTAAPVQTSTPVPTQAATNPPKATSTPSADLSSDEQAVRADAEALKINSISQTAVYCDLDLDKNGANGSNITWESSNTKYIDIQMISHIQRNYTGVVTRPKEDECDASGGVPVTLTATLKKGNAVYTKTFDVSVRKWNPIYYNDFQADVGMEAEGNYQKIADNVTAANGEKFRGIRVDTLNESRSFKAFEHGDKDTPAYFDKRIMSVSENRGSVQNNDAENFSLYYNMYNPYGGSTTYNHFWISLKDPETGTAPKGLLMLSMDIMLLNTTGRFNIGFGTSKASQMCRFLMYDGTNNKLGYSGSGLLRYYNNDSATDFGNGKISGKDYYYCPLKEWVNATIVANSDSHKWDLYFDGMQIATGLDFRNAEDIIPTIELTMDRTKGGAYLIDNIYVENLTDDYRNSYWEEVKITSIPYDAAADAYVADAPFLLQYQGTDGLSGNTFTWQSSNTKALSVASKRVNIEDLINFGYTEEQIAEYKAQGINDATVMIATPGDVAEDTYVTLTAKLTVGTSVNRKEFKVLVKKNGSSVSGDDAKALEDADAISSVANGMTVTSDIDLETVGKINGSKITWRSSHSNIISSSGVVTRPSNNAVNVTLTAVVQYGEAVQYKTFTVTVSPKSTSNNTGGGGGGGGGGGIKPSNSNGIASAPVDKTPVTNNTVNNNTNNNVIRPAGSPSFDDLDKAAWAKDAIEYLYSKDIVNGYGNGLYGVNDDVTREQFIRMLLTALNIKLVIDEDTTFSDVLPDMWYTNYVNAALNMGIVNGISDDSFGVGQSISRQDMAVMCMRAFEYISETPQEEPTAEPEVTAEPEATEDPEATAEPETTAEPEVSEEPETTDIPEATEEPADEETELSPIDNVPVFDVADSEVSSILTFGDTDEISDYAMKAVAMMTKAGYLKGNDMGYFMPKKSLTRAETAMLLYRIITQEDL